MAVKKLSVSVPEEVAAAAAEAAEAAGVGLSAWFSDAARERLDRIQRIDVGFRAAQSLVLDYEAEHGPISQDVHDWANEVLVATGLEPEPWRGDERAAG